MIDKKSSPMSNQIIRTCIQLIGLLLTLVFVFSEVQTQMGSNYYRSAEKLG